MRTITNSAGLTGATPTWEMRRPLSMSSCVLVERSQTTKYASSFVTPCSAPMRHWLSRKRSIVWRKRAHSGSALGSKTAHWVPSSIDSSSMMNRRRTLMYFQAESLVRTRAPHTRLPRPGDARRALTFCGVVLFLLAVGDRWGEPSDRAPDVVRRRLVDAAQGVGAGVDAGHEPRRGNLLDTAAGARVGDIEPRGVEGRVR